MAVEETITFGEAIANLGSGILWTLQNIGMSFYNLGYALLNPQLWLDWTDKENA